ncbi:Uncharacterized protein dnm_083510 [Desulfonema magnum]|uniref:Uncharacterized protein n=1 Tax=Desulfonema magnum TaxID=45655 RepID=A0A975BW71_9BACT|nr:Uncharacterized protein dnm_083510 [Desulfonema magnum]
MNWIKQEVRMIGESPEQDEEHENAEHETQCEKISVSPIM